MSAAHAAAEAASFPGSHVKMRARLGVSTRGRVPRDSNGPAMVSRSRYGW